MLRFGHAERYGFSHRSEMVDALTQQELCNLIRAFQSHFDHNVFPGERSKTHKQAHANTHMHTYTHSHTNLLFL